MMPEGENGRKTADQKAAEAQLAYVAYFWVALPLLVRRYSDRIPKSAGGTG